MKEGKELKAAIPGGMSAPILKADEIDIQMDFDSLVNASSMLGSAAIIVIDKDTSILDVLKLVTKFYSHESCGQCTPCRVGTSWINRAVERLVEGKGKKEDIDNIERVASNILGKTLCPMGDAAAMPILSITRKFRKELESYVQE
jgi:NADH-quinone oxidoreductase subunit F